MVDELYEEYDFYYDVISKLRDAATITEPIRRISIQIASARLWEDAGKLYEQTRRVRYSPDHNEMTYRETLDKANRITSLEPNNLFYIAALGMAQYRAGAYDDALATLARAEKISREENLEPAPVIDGFRAMALHQLGRKNDANTIIRQLRGGFNGKWFSKEDNEWATLFLTLVIEVEKLFAGEDSTLLSIWDSIESAKLDQAREVIEEVRLSKNAEYVTRTEGAINLLSILYDTRGKERWNKSGEYTEMIADYEIAVRIDPNNARAFTELGWIYATCPVSQFRDGNKAVKIATKACELTDWKNHETISTLAAAYSEAGDFDGAVKSQEEAVDLIPEDRRADLQAEYQERLELYQSGKSFCEGARWSFSTGELVAWWRFDEIQDDNAVDSSGHGLHGRLVGEASIVADRERGNVLQIDGDGFVDCGNSPDFDITGSITISSWIKARNSDKPFPIVAKGLGAWTLHRRVLNPDWTMFGCVGLHTEDGIDPRLPGITANPDIYDDRWHLVTGVYDGKKVHLYVDGRLTASKAAWGDIFKNDYPVYIGSNSEVAGPAWNGLIDNVRIYSYALSPQEVKMLYEGREPSHKKEP
jgi:tetratricopeptide (TPR) repeat protein